MVKILSAAAMLALATGAAAPRAMHGQSERTVPIQPIDPSWLQADTVTKTATFELIAGLTGLNGALNFNGFRDGGLTLVVPVGWKTEIAFRNHDGMLPHSAEVIAQQTPLPTQSVDPAIARAFTFQLSAGLRSEAT